MRFFNPVFHPFHLVLAVALLILGFPLVHEGQPHYPRQYITVAGKKMSFSSFGLTNRRSGEPVIIFEGGFGASGAVDFARLYPALSKLAAGIGYDRNGEGESEEDTTIITDVDIAHRLHLFLKTAQVPPPYLLVGHSMGGPYIRLFTALYPGEVAALLFIDPTDFMLTDQQDEQIKILSKSGQGTKAWVVPVQDSLANDTMLSIRIRHRAMHLANFFRNGDFWKLYAALPPLPDIPVAILAAYNKPIAASQRTAGLLARIPIAEHFCMENFADLIRNNHNSFLMLLPQYSHGIHAQDPELVTGVIKRLLDSLAKAKGSSSVSFFQYTGPFCPLSRNEADCTSASFRSWFHQKKPIRMRGTL
jgi:pimeloyl-ACP methyl ester carboxylesterase